MTEKDQQLDPKDLLWGADAIGAALGISERRAFHYLENSYIRGARRIGKRWVVHRKDLATQFLPMLSDESAA